MDIVLTLSIIKVLAMKRYVLLIFSLLLFSATITAQDGISIKAFDEVSHDLDARVNYPKTGQNGKTCALVKVVTTEGDFTFDNGQLGVVAAVGSTTLRIAVCLFAASATPAFSYNFLGLRLVAY